MKIPRYASATAFRRPLEDRLQQWSVSGNLDIQRLRRQVAFDRLLARLFQEKNSPWLLKGGNAMELRLKSARTNAPSGAHRSLALLPSSRNLPAGHRPPASPSRPVPAATDSPGLAVGWLWCCRVAPWFFPSPHLPSPSGAVAGQPDPMEAG